MGLDHSSLRGIRNREHPEAGTPRIMCTRILFVITEDSIFPTNQIYVRLFKKFSSVYIKDSHWTLRTSQINPLQIS
jgi:hypothetical protein